MLPPGVPRREQHEFLVIDKQLRTRLLALNQRSDEYCELSRQIRLQEWPMMHRLAPFFNRRTVGCLEPSAWRFVCLLLVLSRRRTLAALPESVTSTTSPGCR
jgi:hypothetical protein